MKILILNVFLIIHPMIFGQSNNEFALLNSDKVEVQLIEVKKAMKNPILDGKSNEHIWKNSSWHPIDQLWLGDAYDSNDFSGQYKLCWSKDALYILVEIHDDILMDQNIDPLKFWWDDDCVEVFIDEDNSGGEHQYNHNAFAYHIALDGNVVDMAPGEIPRLYNHHIESKRETKDSISIWEIKISIYNDQYNDDEKNNPIELSLGKKIGFAIAYCDNDTSTERENFIGSIFVSGTDKNRGWIDANIFGTIILTD